MKKSSRQAIIKKLIQAHEIETQEELIAILDQEGIQATQATVSRDIRELGIVKAHGNNGEVKYVIIEQNQPVNGERFREMVADSVERVTLAQFIVVIQTSLGSANMLAAIIDELQLDKVAGTIAGADTIAIITQSNQAANELHQLILSYMED
ncbi:arginine repressor [Vagococcus sp. BWB3-3]|uniref:Arginine repressor n=1 Tax=Vagococcus allomyrinae TaxID=2794353 RepID=A0A940P506_9ENTE|nr:arginine repressor [Vagococcus allomyrinae]MBP1039856.1 arginine repressor [Vagococcus allomyrinae]